MMPRRRFVLLSAIVAMAAPAAGDHTPRFNEFPVNMIFSGWPAKPRFTNPRILRPNLEWKTGDLLPDADERYRGSVEVAAERGPNFAGRYTIAEWSCGTGCGSMVIVDAITGKLFRAAPFSTLEIDGNPQSKDHTYAGLLFRKNSSLLIVEGCVDVDWRVSKHLPPDCARWYYQWIQPRWKPLRKTPLSAPRRLGPARPAHFHITR